MVKEKLKKMIPTDVALLSLCVAVLALSINAFLSQRAEGNLSTRQASFELILQLGELDNIVSQVHYNNTDKESNLIKGWGKVALIEDLSMLLPKPFPEKSAVLQNVWKTHHDELGDGNEETVDAVRDVIEGIRTELSKLLKDL